MAETLTPEQAQRKFEEMQRKLKLRKTRKPARKPLPGASGDELYPTDRGLVEFRLASARRPRRGLRRDQA